MAMETLRLERRPEARAFTVEALLELARDGKIRVPEFQRPLRWRSPHVVDFFDSLYRGFPVGGILLSKAPALPGLLHFGPLHVQASAVPDAYFVVDGQQRITALAGALLHPDKGPHGDTHAIWFSLEEERFVRSLSAEPPLDWIPLNVAGSSINLLKWLNDWPLRTERPDLLNRAIALSRALREYQVPAYIVEGASEDVLRRIFVRVNTSGVPMEESEVFDALFGRLEPRPIQTACAHLQEQTGFGVMPDDWFLRCLEAVEGLDARQMLREGEVDSAAIERTEIALRRAIVFLIEDAGIPHIELLPYRLPLVVLARFFHLHPAPDPRTLTLLGRWVWRGALSGAHLETSHAADQALPALIDSDAAASAERLLRTVPVKADFPTASTPWQRHDAKTRLCALAMIHLRPHSHRGEPQTIDWIRYMLDAAGEDGLEVTFVTSRNMLAEPGGSVARHLLCSGRSFGYLRTKASKAALESHGIDEAAAEALRRGDFDAFEQHRAKVLDAWFQRFFTERTAPDESDRPAINALIRRVDAKAVA